MLVLTLALVLALPVVVQVGAGTLQLTEAVVGLAVCGAAERD